MESGSVHNLTHHFAYEELEEATEGFSDTRELGDGGFGTVYKGTCADILLGQLAKILSLTST